MCGCNKAKAVKAAAQKQVGTRQAVVHVTENNIVPTLATVDTSVWGAPLWKILHIAASKSGNRNSIPYWKAVLEAMTSGLPCPDCSAHYNAWYRSHPLRFGLMPNMHQGAIARWVLDIHNDVNRRTGKAVWNIHQLAAYGGESIMTAKALADSLNGVIGPRLSGALSALLRAL